MIWAVSYLAYPPLLTFSSYMITAVNSVCVKQCLLFFPRMPAWLRRISYLDRGKSLLRRWNSRVHARQGGFRLCYCLGWGENTSFPHDLRLEANVLINMEAVDGGCHPDFDCFVLNHQSIFYSI